MMLPWPLIKGALLASIVALSACSSFDDEEELGPAELIEFTAEKVFDRIWSQSVGDGQGDFYNRLQPAIAGNAIYVASADGDVEAFALKDGDSLWDISTDLPVSGAISVIADVVYLGTLSGDVVALNKATGDELWRSHLGSEILSAAAGTGELTFFQTLDGQLVALDAASGDKVWSYRNTMPVLTLRGTSSPVYGRGVVAAGFANGKVVAFNAQTGALLWSTRVASSKGNSEIERIVDIDGDLILDDGIIYAVSYQGSVAAIDVKSGERMWQRDASSYTSMGEGFGNLYVSNQDGSLIAFAKNGQNVRWEQTVLTRRVLTGAVTIGNYVIVGDAEGYLHAMSQLDGHMAAREMVDSAGLRSRLLVNDSILYIYSNDGTLSAYQLLDEPKGFFSF